MVISLLKYKAIRDLCDVRFPLEGRLSLSHYEANGYMNKMRTARKSHGITVSEVKRQSYLLHDKLLAKMQQELDEIPF